MENTVEHEGAQGQDGSVDPGTRWLDREEQQAWRHFLYGVSLLWDNLSNDLERDPSIDLTLGEYEILVRLSEVEGRRMRMSDLADQVVHSRSRLTHTISRLEKRGIVSRERCAADGRGREAVLTDAGFDLLRHAAPRHVATVNAHVLDRIGRKDLLELGRILSLMRPQDAP